MTSHYSCKMGPPQKKTVMNGMSHKPPISRGILTPMKPMYKAVYSDYNPIYRWFLGPSCSKKAVGLLPKFPQKKTNNQVIQAVTRFIPYLEVMIRPLKGSRFHHPKRVTSRLARATFLGEGRTISQRKKPSSTSTLKEPSRRLQVIIGDYNREIGLKGYQKRCFLKGISGFEYGVIGLGIYVNSFFSSWWLNQPM